MEKEQGQLDPQQSSPQKTMPPIPAINSLGPGGLPSSAEERKWRAQTDPGGPLQRVRKIIIDKEHGPVTTLQQAIDLADEGTTIKICEGAHDAAVRITKPNIKIEPREKDKPVYLIGTEGPLITVELPPGETCILKKLILIHSSSGAGGGRRFKEQY